MEEICDDEIGAKNDSHHDVDHLQTLILALHRLLEGLLPVLCVVHCFNIALRDALLPLQLISSTHDPFLAPIYSAYPDLLSGGIIRIRLLSFRGSRLINIRQ